MPVTMATTIATTSGTSASASSFAVTTAQTMIAPPTETSMPAVRMMKVMPDADEGDRGDGHEQRLDRSPGSGTPG